MNGVLIVDKPKNFTSFDVVAVVRGLTGQKKIGHTGTLDPNATGVLPLLLGNATKAQDIIPNCDKAYIAEFKLGMTTDTLDIWGEVKNVCESRISREQLKEVIPDFSGRIEQLPPMYSAVYHNGKRLYDLARQGIEVERKPRKVTVYELNLVDFDEASQRGVLSVSCSKGTYIRTIIDDIGTRLGVGAVMTALDRVSACGYTKDDSLTLDKLKKLAENGALESKLMSTESLFSAYREIVVSDAQAKRFYNGGALDTARTSLSGLNPADGEIYRVKDRKDTFFGLGIVCGNILKIYKHF